MPTEHLAPPDPTPPASLRRLADLPGPRGWPVVGSLLQLRRGSVHRTVEQWSRSYGPYFRMRLGASDFLVVSDHEAIGAALRDRPDGFRRPPRLEVIWREMGFLPGLFGANGQAWRRQRRMVMAGFDPGHVRAYFPALSAVTRRLASRWDRAAHGGTVIDLQADLMRFTVDAIAGLAFGTEINTLESGEEAIQRHLDKIFPAVSRRMLAPVPYWRHFRLAADRRLEHSVACVNAEVQKFIGKARERMRLRPELRTRPGNLLEAMIAASDLPDSGVDDRDVAGNVLTMLLAGEDTTANTLAWMVYQLFGNPETLRRAQQQVRRVAGREGAAHVFSHDALDQMDYLEACAHETMRLKPVAPLNLMQALRDTRVGDVHVPAGGMVWCVMRHDALQERYFPNAMRFDPARWMAQAEPVHSVAGSAKRVSMPFGAGPRVCPGRHLALLEMKMVLAMLLNRFDIRHVGTADGREPAEDLSFTMAPVGLQMRVAARSQAESGS